MDLCPCGECRTSRERSACSRRRERQAVREAAASLGAYLSSLAIGESFSVAEYPEQPPEGW